MATREASALTLLDRFADATGLTSGAEPRRYLWTDAFAVCTWVGLGEVERAAALVEQVHRVLGRHRADDEREGWLSGLPEEEAAAHPTAGGLRIGKPLPERGPEDPYDRHLEWERDGQYFHYLTKWAHALARLGAATGDVRYPRWAVELGLAAFDGFSHGVGPVPDRLYWKMSIDLSRPAVPSMGQHDPLDGYVTLSTLRDGGTGPNGTAPHIGLDPDRADRLDRAIEALARMVDASRLDTDDPLGTGSLLSSAWFLARVTRRDQPRRREILERALAAAERSLSAVRRTRFLQLPATQRLAFRELGLAIGLAAATRLAEGEAWERRAALSGVAAQAEPLAGWAHLRRTIQDFWLDPANRRSPTWADHEDINTVMLAASLEPEGYLGEPVGG